MDFVSVDQIVSVLSMLFIGLVPLVRFGSDRVVLGNPILVNPGFGHKRKKKLVVGLSSILAALPDVGYP